MKSGIAVLFACFAIGSPLGMIGLAECPAQSTKTNSGTSSESKAPESKAPESASPPTRPPKQQTTGDPNKILDLTFNDLEFEMEKEEQFERSMLTSKIKDYHGKYIRLRGFIKPNSSETGLKFFVFVRDNKECCFGPGAAIFDNVLVKMAKGTVTDYTVRPVTIEGQFSLKEYKGLDGTVYSIYRLRNAKVK